ncbi:uncharacterized protein HMPREF1541_10905 [Cyphellophora europaea CBS 101466]|uniref:Uncharacterized protein n=1 Tax=Cyphellophora europaea (strain CBS 101466) TaxID=1220924 RepID=W2S600_CYPE1|nr:uncharacterized protein HMPREF1541_10905 [Cyphellophora europaea CBS 101466]ETN44040.1 hypothetical protein HMPREF1541_10905 [Cyphellophora europaea CBS 101466]
MAALLTKFDNSDKRASSTAIEGIELPRWRGQSRSSSSLRTSSLFDDAQTEASSLYSRSATLTPATTTESACFGSISLHDLQPIRTLLFSRSVLWSDPTISLASGLPDVQDTPLYHASTHELKVWLPDVISYRSTPTVPKAFIIAAAHFRFSRNARLAFGNNLKKLNGADTHNGDVAWELLKNTSTFLCHYQYDFIVPQNYEPRSVSLAEDQYPDKPT